jgi:hypothetical protein
MYRQDIQYERKVTWTVVSLSLPFLQLEAQSVLLSELQLTKHRLAITMVLAKFITRQLMPESSILSNQRRRRLKCCAENITVCGTSLSKALLLVHLKISAWAPALDNGPGISPLRLPTPDGAGRDVERF